MASTSASTSWMPAQGKNKVSIGLSLGRALKARKQGGTPPATNPKRNLPDRDFYSFRYNFKPTSIDPSKPGMIETKGKDKSQLSVEHLSSQAGEAYVYSATETQAKEWDCVLIYDEETGAYTLEKLDSLLILTYKEKRTPTARLTSPSAPSPQEKAPETKSNDDDLERELIGLTEDIPSTNTKPKRVPSPPRPVLKQEEEEEEEEEIPLRRVRDPTPPPPLKTQPPKPARTTKPIPKSRPSTTMAIDPSSNTIPPPAASLPKTKQPPSSASKAKKAVAKRDAETLGEPNTEDMESGRTAKRAKIPAISVPTSTPASASVSATQKPASSEGFAFPGASNTFIAPPPLLSPPSSFSSKVQRVPVTAPSAPQPTLPSGADEESEEDWEEVGQEVGPSTVAPVQPQVPRAMSYHSDNGEDSVKDNDNDNDGLFGDGDSDGDGDDMEAALALELNEGMAELEGGADPYPYQGEQEEEEEDWDSDFVAAEMNRVIVDAGDHGGGGSGGQPMSLNRFANGGLDAMDDSDDDFSSSDESDDE